MELSIAKTLFKEGVLKEAKATIAIEGGYNLQMIRNTIDLFPELLETTRGEARRFKTAQAVLTITNEIGFKKVTFYS
jgi:hypothetical protein